ncbi:MAG: hypothetical protein ACJ760_13240, partial [Thermoleophilaceae bacterium]
DAFAKLESHLRHAHGLGKHERARLLGTARLAEKRETQQHRACDALAILEDLRRAIARSAAPDTGAVTKVEVAILHTARGAACGYRARSVTIEPQGFGGGPKPLKRVPATPDEEHANPRAGAGTGPRPGPPTNVIPVPPGHEFATGSSPFAFSTITDLRSPYLSAPEEPTEASAGQVVWYTGNNGDAFSVDGGATFKKVDPRRMFPEGDTAFCCDQVVVYAPRINRFIWYMQYWCPAPDTRCDELGSTNQVRLAVASPQALLAHRGDPAAAWRVWAIAPRDVRRRHDWFDYPALGLGRHSLYLTSNIYHGHPGESAGRFTGGLIGRVSLAELAKGRGFKLDYRVDHDLGDFRPVQGVGTRGFVTTHASLTELLTFSWDERSPLLLAHRTRHSVIANADYESLSSGFDWDARTNERVLTAARRRDELWLAWSEGRSICRATGSCDPFWPQPHIHVVVVDRNTYRLRHERFIHNPDYAISYPSLAVDSRGRVGMSFSYGGGSAGNASTAAGFLTGGEVFRQVATNPQAGYQGDYFALRQDWPATGRFTGSGYVMGAGAGGSQVVRRLFYRYSR